MREAQSLYENLKQLVEKAKTGAEELEVDEEKREKAADYIYPIPPSVAPEKQ